MASPINFQQVKELLEKPDLSDREKEELENAPNDIFSHFTEEGTGRDREDYNLLCHCVKNTHISHSALQTVIRKSNVDWQNSAGNSWNSLYLLKLNLCCRHNSPAPGRPGLHPEQLHRESERSAGGPGQALSLQAQGRMEPSSLRRHQEESGDGQAPAHPPTPPGKRQCKVSF